MEILMDFNKPSISKNIEKFLLDNLKTEKEKESLINVTTGKSVLKADAIALLISIVKAMTIADGRESEEFEPVIATGDDKVEPTQGTSNQAIAEDKAKINEHSKHDPKKTVCKFYSNGSCKYKHECRFDHPKMCKKFTKNGLFKKWNPTGCDAKCNKFHPNV